MAFDGNVVGASTPAKTGFCARDAHFVGAVIHLRPGLTAAATEFDGRILDHDVIMLLPGGMVLDERAAIVESMSGQPWSSYELEDLRALQPTPDMAVVTYGVVAQWEGAF